MKFKDRLNRFLDEIEENEQPAGHQSEQNESTFAEERTTTSSAGKFVPIDASRDPRLSVIRADATVFGDVTTSAPLQMNGKVIGNITCNEHLQVYGDVDGSVKCTSLEVRGCQIVGPISCEQDVFVDEKAKIQGDCWNSSIALQGVIYGNIYAKEKIRLYATAEVYGNVTGRNIVIDDGAAIQGNIKIKR